MQRVTVDPTVILGNTWASSDSDGLGLCVRSESVRVQVKNIRVSQSEAE